LGLENPGNFSRDSGIFLPEFKGFFSANFFEIFSLIFFPKFFRHIICRIIFKTKWINEGHFHANSRFKFLNLMGFPNIVIILRILFGFFQVFYAIFRDFLGFWDLVRIWDFSKDFFGFLMKCTKIFRVIYPSVETVSTCVLFLIMHILNSQDVLSSVGICFLL
jgi:hypothetical protein